MNQILPLFAFICLATSIRAQSSTDSPPPAVQDGAQGTTDSPPPVQDDGASEVDQTDEDWKHGFSECVHGVRTMYFYKENEQTCAAANDQVIAKRK